MNHSDPTSDMRISELARRAGVTVRTVRYYLSEGLLPPPAQSGRYARYDTSHLQRLRLILKLKEAFLPLEEIRIRLGKLTEIQISELLDSWEPPESPDAAGIEQKSESLDDAASYLSRLRESQRSLDRVIDDPEEGDNRILSWSKELPPASILQSDILDKEYEPPNPELQSRHFSLMAPDDVENSRGMPESSDQTLSSTWQRIPLANGLELHVNEEFGNKNKQMLSKLTRLIRQFLDTSRT